MHQVPSSIYDFLISLGPDENQVSSNDNNVLPIVVPKRPERNCNTIIVFRVFDSRPYDLCAIISINLLLVFILIIRQCYTRPCYCNL